MVREGRGVVVGGCLFWVGFLFCILYLIFCMVCDVCVHLSSLLFLFVKLKGNMLLSIANFTAV